MAQADAEEKTILVWAAGNAHGRRCIATTENCEEYQSKENAINAVSVEGGNAETGSHLTPGTKEAYLPQQVTTEGR